MSNTYQFNVLTIDGAALIAQATAANPIVYVGALSKATAAASAAELATAPASWYTGKTGEIVAVSATGNVAEIRAVWRNAGLSQAAKSVAVTARLASQSDAQAVVMTAMSDPDATIVLPGSTDTGAGVAIPFYVQIGATGSVEVTPGACASIADLARFVSIHAAGNPNAGDAQTVRGEKTFENDAHFLGGVLAASASVSGQLSVGGALLVGDEADPVLQVHPDGVFASSAGISGQLSVGGDLLTRGALLVGGDVSAANISADDTVSAGSLFECRAAYGGGAYYTQGLYGMNRIQYYDSRYQDTVDVRAECSAAPRWWVTFGDVDPVLLVTPDGVSISGGFTPPTPEYDSGTGTSIPVGGIVLAAIAAADSAGGANIHCGETVVYNTAASNPPWLMAFARGNAGSVLGVGAGMPSGTYKFLCDCGVAYNIYSFALVIRVA